MSTHGPGYAGALAGVAEGCREPAQICTPNGCVCKAAEYSCKKDVNAAPRPREAVYMLDSSGTDGLLHAQSLAAVLCGYE